MSFDNFIKTLSKEQKDALLAALSDNSEPQSSEPQPVKKKAGRPKKPTAPKTVRIREDTGVVVNEDFTVTRKKTNQKNRVAVKAKPNTWEDTGESRDVETPEYQPTKRARPKPKYVKAKCSVCNKDMKVRKDLVYGEFFRCDKCVGRGR